MNCLIITPEEVSKVVSTIDSLKTKVLTGETANAEDLDTIKEQLLLVCNKKEIQKGTPAELVNIISTFIAQTEKLPSARAEYTFSNGRHLLLNCEADREIYFVKHNDKSPNAYIIGHFSSSDARKLLRDGNPIPFGEIFCIVKEADENKTFWYFNNWGFFDILPHEAEELLQGGEYGYLHGITEAAFNNIAKIYHRMMRELISLGYDEDITGNEGTRAVMPKGYETPMSQVVTRHVQEAFEVLNIKGDVK